MRRGKQITFAEYMRLQLRVIRIIARQENMLYIAVIDAYSEKFRSVVIEKHGGILP